MSHSLAVCRRAIEIPAVRQAMDAAVKERYLTSRVWLTPQQAASFYSAKLYERCTEDPPKYSLSLPTDELQLDPAITPLNVALDDIRRRSFLKENPVPENVPTKTMLVHQGGSWTVVPENLRTFASLTFKSKYDTERPLFLNERYEGFLAGNPVLTLFNAQSAANPFSMDPTLFHSDLASNTPFPPQLASGLTTLRAQHKYESVLWLLEEDVFKVGLRPRNGEAAHCGVDVLHTGLYNVADMDPEVQQAVLARVPRWVKGVSKPHYRLAGRWRQLHHVGPRGKGSRPTGSVNASLTAPNAANPSDPTSGSPTGESPKGSVDHIWFSAHDFGLLFPQLAVPSDIVVERALPFPDRFFNRDQLLG